MKNLIPYITYTAIGSALFAGSYVGIAAMSGAPLHEVAGINFFVEPPEVVEDEFETNEVATTETNTDPQSGEELLEANVGLLGAYMIESPFSGTELRDLVNELKRQQREHTLERERLQVRALELDEWEQALRERQSELAELRTKLEDLEGTIDLRMAELIRDEGARNEEELASWKKMAKLYTDGTPEVNALMLAEESPEDAALILHELDEAQAGEILRLMEPTTLRKKYLDAYRLAGTGSSN